MPVEEHTITIDGVPVYYRDAPLREPDQAVPLYLHGAPTSSDDWIPFLERTGGVAPDLIGFGRSGKGGHLDYSPSGITTFVERFERELGLERVKLVGHGWGGAIALLLAGRDRARGVTASGFGPRSLRSTSPGNRSDRSAASTAGPPGRLQVERLVLIDAVPLLDGFQWPRVVRLMRLPVIGELVMGSLTRSMLARRLRAGTVRPDAWSEPELTAVWEQFDQGTQRALLRLHRRVDERRLAELGSELGALEIPALVVWGERDPWLPPELADDYAARLPQAVARRVPDAGHWPWRDDPDVVEIVAEFLSRAPL